MGPYPARGRSGVPPPGKHCRPRRQPPSTNRRRPGIPALPQVATCFSRLHHQTSSIRGGTAMSQPAREEASAALHSAANGYGARILDEPSMLSDVLTDLLPDAPLERNLIIAAAQGGTAALLRQYIGELHMEPDAAVRLAASALAARTG